MAEQVTVLSLARYKEQKRKIIALTAYDYSTAQMLDRSGTDIILVGDSLAMVALGEKTTHAVTVDQMLHHTKAVTRGVERALVTADLPFMSYQVEVSEAIRNAGRFVKEARAQAIKLEGASKLTLEIIGRLVEMGVPVMGHLGFTPQSVHALGGFRVQGKTAQKASQIINEAKLLEAAGAFAIVLEMVPTAVAAAITAALKIPTIGIGAGPHCDGQILVTDDLLGKYTDFKPSFVRRYANIAELGQNAIKDYIKDVQSGSYPAKEESFHLAEAEEEALSELVTNLNK